MNGPSMSMEWFGSDAVGRRFVVALSMWSVGGWRTSRTQLRPRREARGHPLDDPPRPSVSVLMWMAVC